MPMKKFRKIAPTYSGVPFDGKNAQEVVDYVRAHSYQTRAGGNWIKVQTPEGVVPEVTITRDTWAMIESTSGELVLIPAWQFEEDYKRVNRKAQPDYVKIEEPVLAIQLDGNAKEIGDILRDEGHVVRSSDRWVKFFKGTMRVGDWLIKHSNGHLEIMAEVDFSYMYTPTR